MRRRGLCCHPASIRLSVTLVDCIHTTKDFVKIFPRPGNLIIVVFDLQRRYSTPRGTPSAWTQNTRGWENLRFSTEIAIYLGNGTRQAHGCYGTLIGGGSIRVGSDDLE